MKQTSYKLRDILIYSLALFIGIIAFAGQSMAQEKQSLQIGDKAPALQYGKWLKGNPLKMDEPGRLYIVEFWATWCGPCIAMMPHLSEFAKKNEKEATVIGVNIWENSYGDKSKPYDSFLPKVSRFVEQMGNKMDYNIMMDNNEQYMGNNWMVAANQEGLPCSFIIKDEIIQWIGHPIDLDSIVGVVNSANYDVAAARKAAIEKKAEREAAANENGGGVYKTFTEALKEKDYDKVLKIANEEIGKNLSMASMYSFFKFQTLLENVGEDTAMTFLRKWQSEYGDFGFTGSLGALICKTEGLSKESYHYAIDILKEYAEGPNAIPAVMYDIIAAGYANAGEYEAAVKIQKKTIDLAKQALKEGKYAGFILEDTVKGYEKTLENYKKKLK